MTIPGEPTALTLARLERLAEIAVARAVGFAALGILMVVLGLMGDLKLSLRSGAALFALSAAVLMLKARLAPTRPYRRTELWLMLETPPKAPAPVLQRLVGEAMRAAFERWTRRTALAAVGFWLASLAVCV